MFYGAEYWVHFAAVAVAAAQDLFELASASGKPLIILDAELTQETAKQDANEALLRIQWRRGNTTTGSGGSTATPVKKNPSMGSASMTAKVNNTTKATAGTVDTIMPSTWNIRNEKRFSPLPDGTIEVAAGSRICLELVNAPPASETMSGWLLVREVG
jgi:hypothetical protein